VRSVVREVEYAVVARPRRASNDVMATIADEEKDRTPVGRMRHGRLR
jgi:hypothetical protein